MATRSAASSISADGRSSIGATSPRPDDEVDHDTELKPQASAFNSISAPESPRRPRNPAATLLGCPFEIRLLIYEHLFPSGYIPEEVVMAGGYPKEPTGFAVYAEVCVNSESSVCGRIHWCCSSQNCPFFICKQIQQELWAHLKLKRQLYLSPCDHFYVENEQGAWRAFWDDCTCEEDAEYKWDLLASDFTDKEMEIEMDGTLLYCATVPYAGMPAPAHKALASISELAQGKIVVHLMTTDVSLNFATNVKWAIDCWKHLPKLWTHMKQKPKVWYEVDPEEYDE